MPKVTIEREDCISCGVCWSECPEFFEENPDDGFSMVKEEYRSNGNLAEGQAPDELTDCVESAEAGCPVEIIHVR